MNNGFSRLAKISSAFFVMISSAQEIKILFDHGIVLYSFLLYKQTDFETH